MHIHSIHTGLLQDALTLDQYTSVTSWGPLSLLSHELPHRSNPHRIGRCWPPLVGICERPHHPLHCLPQGWDVRQRRGGDRRHHRVLERMGGAGQSRATAPAPKGAGIISSFFLTLTFYFCALPSPQLVAYLRRDLITYAVGIGCDELDFVYEVHSVPPHARAPLQLHLQPSSSCSPAAAAQPSPPAAQSSRSSSVSRRF